MKKFIYPLAVTMLALVSCKKDYTCSCTNTTVENSISNSSTSITKNETTYKDVTKAFMSSKAECFSTEDTWTTQDWLTGELVNVTRTNDCLIEK